MKAIRNLKAVKIFCKLASLYVDNYNIISRHTDHTICCPRFYNPYVM